MATKRTKKKPEVVQHEPAQASAPAPESKKSEDPRPAHLRCAFVDVGQVDAFPNARAKFNAERAAHAAGQTYSQKRD